MGAFTDVELLSVLDAVASHYVTVVYHAKSESILRSRNGLALAIPVSAFVMEVRGRWCLVTAGHVFDEIEDLRSGGVECFRFMICDHWSPDAPFRDGIPIDYFAMDKVRIYQDGFDYGLIPLPQLFAANLQRNGVEPISANREEIVAPPSFEDHALIGTPATMVSLSRIGESGLSLKQTTVALGLDPCDPPPDKELPPIKRFYARIRAGEDSPQWTAMKGNIEGMSGGPIFGLTRTRSGFRYQVFAVQSGWWKEHRIISACYFDEFAQAVYDHVSKSNERTNSQEMQR